MLIKLYVNTKDLSKFLRGYTQTLTASDCKYLDENKQEYYEVEISIDSNQYDVSGSSLGEAFLEIKRKKLVV